MRNLVDLELDHVSGGKSNGESGWLARLQNWFRSIFESSDSGGGGISLTGAELGQMQRDCLDSGGDFRLEQTSQAAGANIRIVNANGSESYFNLTCTSN